MTQPIRVLVVDDSVLTCRVLAQEISAVPDFVVVGCAYDGWEAVRLAQELRPDVITLDVEMPRMNGLEALECIMRQSPAPVIMVTGASGNAAEITLQAVNLGAVDFLLKFSPEIPDSKESFRRELLTKIRAAAGLKVVRPLSAIAEKEPTETNTDAVPTAVSPADLLQKITDENSRKKIEQTAADSDERKPHLVVIGASTGGPTALRELLQELPATFPWAILIVQHLPARFTTVLASQLDRQIPLKVHEAAHGEQLRGGHIYLSPGDMHLMVNYRGLIKLNQSEKVGGHRPSVNVTMEAVAEVFQENSVGIILSGMGEDGAVGLKFLRNRGGIGMAQDESSCVVYGMPKVAKEMGGAHLIGTPQELGQALKLLAEDSTGLVKQQLIANAKPVKNSPRSEKAS